MQPALYEHVLEARVAIECQAARLACENAQTVDIQKMELVRHEIEMTAADPEAGAEADFQFHSALVSASHNEVLLFIHEAVQGLLRRSHLERRRAVKGMPDFLATLGKAHSLILEAIRARDKDRAEAVVRKHLTIAQDYSKSTQTKTSSGRQKQPIG
jgi:GntR family transcriptional regulator, transcriptional repressor for pyruvate dehydrogenase complex